MPKHNSLLPLDSIFRPQIMAALDTARYADNPGEFSLPQELHELLYHEITSKADNLFKRKYSAHYSTNIPSRDLKDSIHDFLSHKLVECLKNFSILSALTGYIASSAADYHRNRIIAEAPKKSLEQEEIKKCPKATISPDNSDLMLEIEETKAYLPDYPGNQDLIEAIFQLFADKMLPVKPKQIFSDPDVEKWICEICSKQRCPDRQKCQKCCLISHASLLREWREWKKYVRSKQKLED